ncbi:MAG: hypothetical protein CL609_17325 [Anaerolineaceae bacterium]|nr:hypothetical protein [Anaerolineaceae bacterium]
MRDKGVMLDNKIRYLQIAFNKDTQQVRKILPLIPERPNIFIEAGTPFIKEEGMNGVSAIRRLWKGQIVADLKTIDGAEGEVAMAVQSGANAVTVAGSCPTETLDLFIQACEASGVYSMIDMIGVEDPLQVMRPLKKPPDVVIIHRGRDEESTRGKVIRYKQINKIRSKYDVLIAAAGGIDLHEARSAIFNGANIVVVNLVSPVDGWEGIDVTGDVKASVLKFIETLD